MGPTHKHRPNPGPLPRPAAGGRPAGATACANGYQPSGAAATSVGALDSQLG